MQTSDRVKCKDENRNLKQRVANLSLGKVILQDVTSKTDAVFQQHVPPVGEAYNHRKMAQRYRTTLLGSGIAAGPLFTAAWALEGATRVHYSPLRHPVSSLAIGAGGWTQNVNFIISGLLTLAIAFGLQGTLRATGLSVWGPVLIGAVGIGLIGAGVFTTAPLNGFPPGTPLLPSHYGVAGRLHRLFSSLVFLGLPAACFVFGRYLGQRGERGTAAYSRASGAAFIILFMVTSAGFAQVAGLSGYAGLLQRITLTVGWLWLTWVAVYALRR